MSSSNSHKHFIPRFGFKKPAKILPPTPTLTEMLIANDYERHRLLTEQGLVYEGTSFIYNLRRDAISAPDATKPPRTVKAWFATAKYPHLLKEQRALYSETFAKLFAELPDAKK